jgi:hypothetical protein
VIVAGGLVGILALAILAVEGGTIVLNRRTGQNAADLAAIAGTRIVSLSHTATGITGGQVGDAVRDSMDDNECDADAPCEWRAEYVGSGLNPLADVGSGGIPGNALGIRVFVDRMPGAMLGRAMGFDTWTVSTEATAIATSPDTVPAASMLPIAICGWSNDIGNGCGPAVDSPPPGNAVGFQAGQVYDFAMGKDAPGGFAWISWDGGSLDRSANCALDNPAFSVSGAPTFVGAPGIDAFADMAPCLQKWIDTRATVLVPLYDQQSDGEYRVAGVAGFVLTAQGRPTDDSLQGYFVAYLPFAGTPDGTGTAVPRLGDPTVYLGLVK